jgi:hypothetical protein
LQQEPLDDVYIAYLDSSGRPDFDDKENFVLAALITNERNWQIIDNSVKAIKLKHFPGLSDEDVELHAKDMQNQKGIFESLPWETIYAIHNDIFDFVEQTTVEMHIIAIVIEKNRLLKNIDCEKWAYRC